MTEEVTAVSPDWPDPNDRILAGASGTLVRLADGRDWLLADGGLGNMLDEVRNRMFDHTAARGSVWMVDVLFAADVLLRANYELAVEESWRLICKPVDGDADAETYRKSLSDGVVRAMFGQDREKSFTDWALASLAANGLDPEAITGDLRWDVLDILEKTGRTVSCVDFCKTAAKARQMALLRSRIKKVDG